MGAFVIPPLLLYAFGTVIAVMGALRAYHLGWKQRPDVPEESDPTDAPDADVPATEAEADDAADLRGEVRGRTRANWSDGKPTAAHKRHILMGLLWVAMGLFLIISTALNH